MELSYSSMAMGFQYGSMDLVLVLSLCLHLTPTQFVNWSGHGGVSFFLIISGLKLLKHNHRPHNVIQLQHAP